MMTKAFLHLLALLVLLAPSLAHAERIAAMNDPERDYTLEGDVVTVWTDSFLLNDGSGQVIVDIRPYNTYDLRIAGRDYVQVTGRVNDEGVIRPLVLARANARPVMFQGTAMLEPLPLNEVMKNTVRYRLPRRVAPATNSAANAAANQRLAEQTSSRPPAGAVAPNSEYTSTGASPTAAVTPAGSAPAGGAAPATP